MDVPGEFPEAPSLEVRTAASRRTRAARPPPPNRLPTARQPPINGHSVCFV